MGNAVQSSHWALRVVRPVLRDVEGRRSHGRRRGKMPGGRRRIIVANADESQSAEAHERPPGFAQN